MIDAAVNPYPAFEPTGKVFVKKAKAHNYQSANLFCYSEKKRITN